MNLTKIQIAVICACLAAVPIAYEARAIRTARLEASALTAEMAVLNESLAEGQALRDALLRRRRVADDSLAGLPALVQALSKRSPLDVPPWQDVSPFARVPLEVLKQAKIDALGSDWRLRKELGDILAMTPEQFDRAQRALDRFYSEIRALEESHLQPESRPLKGANETERVEFRITRYEPEANAARIRFRDHLLNELGETRADLLVKYLDFAPLRRSTAQPGESLPDPDSLASLGQSSDRWNFYGCERMVTMGLPSDPTLPPTLLVTMTVGSRQVMTFGGGQEVFNPAVAPALRRHWEALASVRPGLPK